MSNELKEQLYDILVDLKEIASRISFAIKNDPDFPDKVDYKEFENAKRLMLEAETILYGNAHQAKTEGEWFLQYCPTCKKVNPHNGKGCIIEQLQTTNKKP